MECILNIGGCMSSEIICHYTNLAGFKGIINSEGFWATQLSFLNDKSELEHGLKCAIKALDYFGDNELYNGWKIDFEFAVEELRTYEMNNLFVICFCRHKDLLSQWRGYGGSQQGVSIVFDEDLLLEMLRRNAASGESSSGFLEIHLDKYSVGAKDVTYKEIEETLTIKSQIIEYWKSYGDFKESLDEDDNSGNESNYLKWLVKSITPFFKHKGFEEEGEFRFLIRNYMELGSVSFRDNGMLIIPYMEIINLGQLPIKEVIIGPSEDFESAHRSLKIFLDAKGYSSVKISKSEIPFRGQ